MGLFRSVIIDYACERCGRVAPAEVQFKTDDDYGDRYELGQRIVGDAQLKRGRRFEGSVYRYCDACFRACMADAADAGFAVLASLVEGGQLVIRPTQSPDALAPAELHRAGAEAREAILSGHQSPYSHRGVADYLIEWLGQDATGFNDAYIDFLRHYNAAIDARMRSRGWAHGSDWLREDVPVYLDDEFRLCVGP